MNWQYARNGLSEYSLGHQEKWHALPLLLGRPETFDKQKEPWIAFSKLIQKRNAIVYLRPADWSHTDGTRGGKDVLMNTELEDLEAYLGSVKGMVDTLFDLVDDDDPRKEGFPLLEMFERVDRFSVLTKKDFSSFQCSFNGNVNPGRASCYYCDEGISGSRLILRDLNNGDTRRFIVCAECQAKPLSEV